MGKNRKFLINRSQYKKIKKMDRLQMDDFFRSMIEQLKDVGYLVEYRENENDIENSDLNECNSTYDLSKDIDKIYLGACVFYKDCIEKSLDLTKGIGAKTKALFWDNFNKVEKEKNEGDIYDK